MVITLCFLFCICAQHFCCPFCSKHLCCSTPCFFNGFRFAYSASTLEDQRPCGKELCSSSVEALVCFNFGSLASYWPRPWSDFGVPLGAGRPPKGGPGASKRQPQTTQTASLECLWGTFGGRASRGGPGASRRQPRRPKMGLPPQSRAGFLKTPEHDEH